MTWRPSNRLVWFAVAGGAFAFTVQFVAGLAFSYAQCNQPVSRWQLPVRDWQVGLAAGGALVTLASLGASLLIFRRTFRIGDVFGEERRGDGHEPPLGRIHFLSQVAITINLLMLPLIIMDGIGTGLQLVCQQT